MNTLSFLQEVCVADIEEDPEFKQWVMSPHMPRDKPGPIQLTWYTKDGKLHTQRVDQLGRRGRHFIAGEK